MQVSVRVPFPVPPGMSCTHGGWFIIGNCGTIRFFFFFFFLFGADGIRRSVKPTRNRQKRFSFFYFYYLGGFKFKITKNGTPTHKTKKKGKYLKRSRFITSAAVVVVHFHQFFFFCEGPQIKKMRGGYGIVFFFFGSNCGRSRGLNPGEDSAPSKAKWTVIYDSPENSFLSCSPYRFIFIHDYIKR